MEKPLKLPPKPWYPSTVSDEIEFVYPMSKAEYKRRRRRRIEMKEYPELEDSTILPAVEHVRMTVRELTKEQSVYALRRIVEDLEFDIEAMEEEIDQSDDGEDAS
jgi:hypothetical protein